MTCEKCGRKIPVDTKHPSVSELFSDIANGRDDYCHECGAPWPRAHFSGYHGVKAMLNGALSPPSSEKKN